MSTLLHIEGPARPEAVSASRLLSVISGIENSLRLISGDKAGFIGVQRIEPGSAKLWLLLAGISLSTCNTLAAAISGNAYDLIPAAAREPLRRVFRTLRERGWVAEIRWDHQDVSPSIRIAPDTPAPTSPTAWRSITTTYGKLIRIGGDGEFSTAVIRDDNGHRILARLTPSAAEKLCLDGALFHAVRIDGEAEINPETERIHRFLTCDISRMDEGSVAEAFREIRGLRIITGSVDGILSEIAEEPWP